ncbi:hypothetical protein NKG05_22960 [Oerskovia sp. M15]
MLPAGLALLAGLDAALLLLGLPARSRPSACPRSTACCSSWASSAP